MTDEERTPTPAHEQAQGAQTEPVETAATGDQQQPDVQQGLLSKLVAAATSATNAAVETTKEVIGAVAERVPEAAGNVADAAQRLVGKDEAASTSAQVTTAQADATGTPAETTEGRSSVAAVAGAVAGAAADLARRSGARVYEAVTGQPTTTAPAEATSGQEQPSAAAPAEVASGQEQPAPGASFEPSEATTRSGRPRRFKDVQPGMQLEGRVTSIALYGVFVDVGVGRDGLVHISEMSDTRVESPTDLVQIGDPVTVWVKSVDPEARRISLTMRDPNRPKPQRERRPRKPEVDLEKLRQLKPGDTVEGTVSSLSPFGAFVDIGVGKDGLVHISELSEGRIEKPEDAVQVGERYTFRVLEADPEGKRISLSLRRALRSQRLQQLEPGTILEGTVSGLAPFGAFVDIGVGRDGLVHISELAAYRVATVEEVVRVGDKVQVKVIEVDPNSKRISLTMRVDEPLPSERPAPVRPALVLEPEEEGERGGRERGGRERGGRERGGRERGGRERGGRERGGRERGGRLRREAQLYDPGEEVYTFEDPEDEETFTGDATLEDLVSKFNAGRYDRRGKSRRDYEDEDEDEDRSARRQRDAIRRTLAIRDEE
ncbi:S1 RNA-binding domain-containing protein [Kallotenue papyrolyticum]|uniref:S1 RNA-binding domain-containing protein n=1 Tax=Kallotenue papyrolyticum TaxID=1325125 RepID=UPI0004927E39|nr:S1 RNA-binding domain-containing protein [Kallotenue papyrolyticum]